MKKINKMVILFCGAMGLASFAYATPTPALYCPSANTVKYHYHQGAFIGPNGWRANISGNMSKVTVTGFTGALSSVGGGSSTMKLLYSILVVWWQKHPIEYGDLAREVPSAYLPDNWSKLDILPRWFASLWFVARCKTSSYYQFEILSIYIKWLKLTVNI